MGNMLGIFSNIFFGILGAVMIALVAYRAVCLLRAKELSEMARCCDKQSIVRTVRRKSCAPYTERKFCVTFVCGNKKRAFDVSAETYDECTVGACGLLKFRGGKFVSFEGGEKQ